jgi:tight adherence protein C
MSYWLLFWGLSGLGFLLLGPVLKRRQRKNRIRLGLPDAVDLTAICIEAGQSPAESLGRVSKVLRHAHPDLSDELYLVNREMRAGYSLDEALCNLCERTDVGDIKVLVDALAQAGPLGVVRVLRAYPNSLRIVRQQRARAQAITARIKLVPALLLFVAPSVLIVTLGPALITLFRAETAGR